MGTASAEVLPSARRLVRSLRDLGYDLAAALSDLVDNSIAAGASSIKIDSEFEGQGSWLRVADNGGGMTQRELIEAMRFGTRRQYRDSELGKFGLGLKAASLSQCKHLTVATRTGESGRINVAAWDLDHVERSDRWEVLRPSAESCPLAASPLFNRSGTVVLWQQLDRLSRFRRPEGRRAKDAFARLMDEVGQHLSMTFHRFIEGNAWHGRPLDIRLNGKLLDGWDPFARGEPSTVVLPLQRLNLQDIAEPVRVQPYVLPSESGFSSYAAHRLAAGPRLWARQQGFYFYRSDRLIQAGGWNRLRTQDEHTKLARVAVDIPCSADELFELNVSKTQVRVPGAIRPELATIASAVSRVASDAYRRPRPEAIGTVDMTTRADAVMSLVRMVVTAAEDVIVAELGVSPDSTRLISRLRQMEVQLGEEVIDGLSSSESNGVRRKDGAHRV